MSTDQNKYEGLWFLARIGLLVAVIYWVHGLICPRKPTETLEDFNKRRKRVLFRTIGVIVAFFAYCMLSVAFPMMGFGEFNDFLKKLFAIAVIIGVIRYFVNRSKRNTAPPPVPTKPRDPLDF